MTDTRTPEEVLADQLRAVVRDGIIRRANLYTILHEVTGDVLQLAATIGGAFSTNGKLLLAGNGGSAAGCQHLAAEYVPRGYQALALTDSATLTAIGNDYGLDQAFAYQVCAHGRLGDVLVLYSTSGESENVIQAAQAAELAGLHTVALTGRDGGRLLHEVDHAIRVPTDSVQLAQEAHLAIDHIVWGLVTGRGS